MFDYVSFFILYYINSIKSIQNLKKYYKNIVFSKVYKMFIKYLLYVSIIT
jgi:hypothetical protein